MAMQEVEIPDGKALKYCFVDETDRDDPFIMLHMSQEELDSFAVGILYRNKISEVQVKDTDGNPLFDELTQQPIMEPAYGILTHLKKLVMDYFAVLFNRGIKAKSDDEVRDSIDKELIASIIAKNMKL